MDELDKLIEAELKRNDELRKLFREHPERRAMYKLKMIDSFNGRIGARQPNPVFCNTCVFAAGPSPYADTPRKAYCMIYDEQTAGKPQDVYFGGEPCEYYDQ